MKARFPKSYLQHLYRATTVRNENKGFTITEVLLAITLSGIVATGLGTALVATLNASNRTDARTQRRSQLNRAIDYVTEDVRRSRFLSATNNNQTLTLEYFPTTGDNINSWIIDYALAPKDPNSPWLGPRVLRRREYAKGATPSNWTVLVDAISENAGVRGDCPEGTTNIGLEGFQACLQVGVSATGAEIFKVDLNLHGELNDFAGGNSNSEVLSVSSAAFARSLSPEGGFLKNPSIASISLSSDLSTALINWTDALGGTQPYSYTLYRCSEGPNNCEIDIASSDSVVNGIPNTVYTDNITGLTRGNALCYAVKVVDATGDISTSNTSCVQLVDALIPPKIEDIWESQGEIGLDWRSAAGGAPGYLYGLLRCDVPGGDSDCNPDILVRDIELAGNSYFPDPVAGISDGRKVCYAVEVKDTTGGTAISEPQCIIKGQPLSAPVIREILPKQSGVDLTWFSASGGDYPYTYDVFRCVTEAENTCTPNSVVSSALEIKILSGDDISEVESGDKVCYAVRVTDESNSTKTSATECFIKDAPLTAPNSLEVNVNPSDGKMNLDWPNATGGTPAYIYNLYRCDADANTTCTPNLRTENVTSVHIDDVAGISKGRNVCYAIQVTDTEGNTAQTETVCETKIEPLVLSGLVATVDPGTSEATISWTSIAGGSVATPSYSLSLQRCTGDNCTPDTARGSTQTTTSTGGGSFTDSVTGIAEGTNICYAVQLTDGDQSTSRQACTTLVSSLAAPVISLNNSSLIRPTVSWTGISSATGYRIFSCQGISCDPLSGSTTNSTNLSFTPASDPNVGNQWCFAVRATNSSIVSPTSNQVCGAQRGLSKPIINSINFSSNTLVGGNSSDQDVSVTWLAPSGGTAFNLFYCEGNNCTLPNTAQVTNLAVTNHIIGNLAPRIQNQNSPRPWFCFGVKGKQGGLTSDMSDRICIQSGNIYNSP